MKKMIAVILCLVLFVMTGAVAETVETEATVIALAETMELVVEAAQAENAETVWASSDETIVTVDANGVATALNAGEAVITATVTTTTVETVAPTPTLPPPIAMLPATLQIPICASLAMAMLSPAEIVLLLPISV